MAGDYPDVLVGCTGISAKEYYIYGKESHISAQNAIFLHKSFFCRNVLHSCKKTLYYCEKRSNFLRKSSVFLQEICPKYWDLVIVTFALVAVVCVVLWTLVCLFFVTTQKKNITTKKKLKVRLL